MAVSGCSSSPPFVKAFKVRGGGNPTLEEFIRAVQYGLPSLHNIEFADPPIVECRKDRIGDVEFNGNINILALWK